MVTVELFPTVEPYESIEHLKVGLSITTRTVRASENSLVTDCETPLPERSALIGRQKYRLSREPQVISVP